MQLSIEQQCHNSKPICEIFHPGLVTEGVRLLLTLDKLVARLIQKIHLNEQQTYKNIQ